jgi:short-subunit dehydrogenase
MARRLSGMHALVTGASSGIGEALAIELGRAACKVSLSARRRDRLDAVADAIRGAGGEARVFPADLARPGSARALAAEVAREAGPVDLLVSNAGTNGGISNLADKSAEEVRQALELNLAAPLELAHAVLPGMIARGGGTIVSIASVAACFPAPGTSTYVATKRALAALDEVLRVEGRAHGVHVLTVFPGPVDTAMLRATIAADPLAAQMSWMPTGDVATLAKKIRRALERRDGVLVYPEVYGGLRWIAPWMGRLLERAEPLLPRRRGS